MAVVRHVTAGNVQAVLKAIQPSIGGEAKMLLLAPGELIGMDAMHSINRRCKATGIHAFIVTSGKCEWPFKVYHNANRDHVLKVCRSTFAHMHDISHEKFVNGARMLDYLRSVGIDITEINDLRVLTKRMMCTELSQVDRDMHVDRDTKDILFGEKMEPEAC